MKNRTLTRRASTPCASGRTYKKFASEKRQMSLVTNEIYIYIYIYICLYVCMYVCMYVFKYVCISEEDGRMEVTYSDQTLRTQGAVSRINFSGKAIEGNV